MSQEPPAAGSPLPVWQEALQLGETVLTRVAEEDWDGVITLQEQREQLAAEGQARLSLLGSTERPLAIRLLQALNHQLQHESHVIRQAMTRNRSQAMQLARAAGALEGYGTVSGELLPVEDTTRLDVEH
ncbi:MAG: hypothetical protein VKO21_00090 [Candidatus Sericytochromatia bacterium]|nr:hypothetical protein [Candidatus Sericytochromatia bacterium]